MASLQHLGGDRWRVRVYVEAARNNGRPRSISRTFHANGERAARRQAATVEAAIRAELDRKIERAKTVDGIIDDWLAVKRRDKSPTTIAGYEYRCDKIRKRFGRLPADQLTGRHLDDWYGELLDAGTSPAEINHIHAVLRNVLRWTHTERGTLPDVATDRAHPPAHLTPEIEPPTTAAVVAVLGRLPDAGNVHWARALRLVVYTGVRRGEVVGLRWDDWTAGWMKVRHSIVKVRREMSARTTKGKRSRMVPLSPDAEQVLLEQRAWLIDNGFESPWVFPAIPDVTRPRPPSWLGTAWTRWRNEHAPGIRIHDLRHHYATMLIDAGVPLHVVQKWLGHAKVSTTMDIYGHATQLGEAEGMRALGALAPRDEGDPD